jgi:DnaJ family protein C protein 2
MASFKLVLGPPPASGKESRTLAPLSLVITERSDALPIGREAVHRAGGRVDENLANKKAAGGFPDHLINIPDGINPVNLKDFTFYDILGFTPEWADSADHEAIRRAYHKAVLKYHPDKAQFKTTDGKEDRTVFLKIQDAFNVLSNEAKRRAYDSQLPFDESIPSEERVEKALAKGPAKFFKLFDTVFKRNARFAVRKPVPEIGDADTPMQDVYKFYDYWVRFESWRDFTGVGAEHKPDEASSREEKRYMQKENEKLAKKLKRKEMERLIALVNLAQSKDPRLTAEKDAKKAAKEAEKQAKEDAIRKKADEEAEAKAWAAQQEIEANEIKNMTKEAKEKLKKAQSNARNILRKLLRVTASLGHGGGREYGILSDADAELICTSELEGLNIMNSAMGGAPATKDSALFLMAGTEEVLTRLVVLQEKQTQEDEDKRMLEEARKREIANSKASVGASVNSKEKVVRVWTRDTLSLLAKAIMRYPPGFANRWGMICNYMNDLLKPADAFTQEECLAAAFKASKNIPVAGATA